MRVESAAALLRDIAPATRVRGDSFFVAHAAPEADSAALVRLNLATRRADTVARVRVWTYHCSVDTLVGGVTRTRTVLEVLPNIDDWTVLADGTVAIVRGIDYHIDWIRPDGSRLSTPKIPIDWRRMTDDEKRQRVAAAKSDYEAAYPEAMTRGPNVIEFAPPSSLPDWLPPVSVGSMRSDRDGNVWILPSSSSYGGYPGFAFDVVNRSGQLVERVRLPRGRELAGFGPDGTVFMTVVDTAGTWVERARR